MVLNKFLVHVSIEWDKEDEIMVDSQPLALKMPLDRNGKLYGNLHS